MPFSRKWWRASRPAYLLPTGVLRRYRNRAIVLLLAGWSTFFAGLTIQEGRYWWSYAFSFVVILASLFEFVVADRLFAERYPARTRQVLLTISDLYDRYAETMTGDIERFITTLKNCDHSKVVATCHLRVEVHPTPDSTIEEGLVQLVDYVGREGNTRWRYVPATQGVVGRCLRTRKLEAVNFGSEQEYLERMVSDFGFSKQEAQRHNKTARSYAACPLSDNDQLFGVLYLYTPEQGVFPGAIDAVQLAATEQAIRNLLKGAGVLT